MPQATATVSQSQNIMQFVQAYPGVIVVIMSIMAAALVFLAREDIRRLWATAKGKEPKERRSNDQLHEVVTSLDKTVGILSTTVQTLQSTAEGTNRTLEKISTELFKRVRDVEKKVEKRDAVCETMSTVCPHRNGHGD